MGSVLLLALQLGFVAGGFVGMSKAFDWYHGDDKRGRGSKGGGGMSDVKSRHS